MSLLSPNRLRARVASQLHWRVPFEAGIYANSPRWSNKDLDPVPIRLRTWSAMDFWTYWASDMLAPPLASTVSSVMALGFTARETIPLVFFGFAICSVVVTLVGKIGAQYNIPFPVIVRSVFGMWGSYPMIMLRAFVAAMWTVVLCVQGGDFFKNCVEAIWPSFRRFPNHLSPDSGITSAGLLCFFLYWIVQTVLALLPIKKLRILFIVKAIIVPPTFLALFLWAVIVTKGGGPLVTGPTKLTSPYMNKAYSALTGLNAIIGLFSSLSVNIPDFSRFSKNGMAGYHQFFALPIIGTLGSLTPIFVTSAHSYIWGEFQWYMPAVIEQFSSRPAQFFTGFAFLVATIGNQIAADTYPFSNDISGLCPKYINVFRAAALLSLFCIITTPWNIIKNASGLLAFLSGYSCFMGPLAGVMVSDFYLIKKGKLNIHELYKDQSIYHYSHGFNWRAYVAFCLGFAPLMPGFAKSINHDADVGGAWKIYTFAWLFGFFISTTSYYLICTFISYPASASVQEAVLPPQRGDAEDTENDEEAIVEGMSIESTSAMADEKVKGDLKMETKEMSNNDV